jgi:hypothetical protein
VPEELVNTASPELALRFQRSRVNQPDPAFPQSPGIIFGIFSGNFIFRLPSSQAWSFSFPFQRTSTRPATMSGKKKVRAEKEENVTLGPTVREGEHVFGVAHIFASFNDTFVHVTDLSGKETMARVTGVVPLPLFCSSCYRGVHDFLWPVNPNSQIF